MPRKNVTKQYVENGYYHIYNRGVNKNLIFQDDEDYGVFLNLFKRYLSEKPVKDKKNREYPHYYDDLQLIAFCLMPNHFHAFVHQKQQDAITQLFKSLITTYSMYFNKKYVRIGPLFQSNFCASLITSQSYYEHVSRYIHLNPKDYQTWPYSSLPYYLSAKKAEWIQPEIVMSLFHGAQDYLEFCSDYEDQKEMLEELKYELANTD